MSKKSLLFCVLFLAFVFSSFSGHKFYVSIYKVDFVPEKKRIEITARIFLDDMTLALEKEYKTKIHLGEKTETPQDVTLLQKYMNKRLRVFMDNAEKPVLFLSKEIEDNVVIMYFKVNDIAKIKNITIHNNALLELYPDQQNIMQTNFYNKKKNYIFTDDYFQESILIP
ncbi:DUF6702 family protein [Flavobacterium sp.]|uniref:DUF6702 family protein n=1 Tax=Flavobacterium sp. TaxID=239 RepID=UPI0026336038|nr:DUF6702 family protein [Flavobacterium sp.]MDD3004859.1 hypothetical protein [Flavobacterium sp.]